MWKKTLFLAGLCGALLMTTALGARGETGLKAFGDKKEYTEGMFADVAERDWYAAGVRTVYAKGIMEGVGDGRFDPARTVTWSQAVTIAARLHAAYRGGEVPQTGGAWYESYVTYAREAGLLPGLCPGGEAVNTANITREGMAVLFRGVLEAGDLPPVNDRDIPDLDRVAEGYRTAVRELYAAGVITGKADGSFDPSGEASRAEVATIVTRLLCPNRRVSHDSRENPSMAGQQGNYYNGGLAVMAGDVTYLYNRERIGREEWQYVIAARTADGEQKLLYTTEKALSYLSLDQEGRLCVKEDNMIRRVDTETGRAETIYTSGGTPESYQFYGGDLYIGEETANRTYRIGRLSGSRLEPIVDGMTFDQSGYTAAQTFYLYGGRLYYMLRDGTDSTPYLYGVDLDGGRKERVAELYLSGAAFQGNTVWYTAGTDGEPLRLMAASLVQPEPAETAAVLPEACSTLYQNIYANGSQLYFQSSGAARLWRISSAGGVEEEARAATAYIEYSTVLDQELILHALRWLNILYPEQIRVRLADGTWTNYCAFAGSPYALTGEDLLEAVEEQTWEAPEKEDEVQIEPLRVYWTQEGDAVLEVWVRNGLDKAQTVWGIDTVPAGRVESKGFFQVFDEQVCWDLEAGEEKVFSLVFPARSYTSAPRADAVTVELTVYHRDVSD